MAPPADSSHDPVELMKEMGAQGRRQEFTPYGTIKEIILGPDPKNPRSIDFRGNGPMIGANANGQLIIPVQVFGLPPIPVIARNGRRSMHQPTLADFATSRHHNLFIIQPVFEVLVQTLPDQGSHLTWLHFTPDDRGAMTALLFDPVSKRVQFYGGGGYNFSS
jgi:hypothetical protein